MGRSAKETLTKDIQRAKKHLRKTLIITYERNTNQNYHEIPSYTWENDPCLKENKQQVLKEKKPLGKKRPLIHSWWDCCLVHF